MVNEKVHLLQHTNAIIYASLRGSIFNHLWYVCPELVVLAFFDDGVSHAEKQAMAQALLQHPRPAAFAPGKPAGRHFEQVQ